MVSLFTSQTPVNDDVNDSTTYTLATEWETSVPGTVTGVRVYTSVTQPGTLPLVGVLYRVDGETTLVELARADATAWASAQWLDIVFAVPVAVVTGQRYAAAYITPDRFVSTLSLFDNAVANSPLTAPAAGGGARNGRIGVGDTAPTGQAFSNSCYFADVLFTADDAATGTADLSLSLTVAATGRRTSAGAAALGVALAVATVGRAPARGAAALSVALAVSAAGPVPSTPGTLAAGTTAATLVATAPAATLTATTTP